jgi:hypothetical protein
LFFIGCEVSCKTKKWEKIHLQIRADVEQDFLGPLLLSCLEAYSMVHQMLFFDWALSFMQSKKKKMGEDSPPDQSRC